jgi:transposase
MKILALDVGKYKTVGYKLDTTTGEVEFRTIRTRPADMERLLASWRPDRLVLEVGAQAGWIHDLAQEVGVREIEVANASHEGWRWRNVKRKTDRLDAVKLADLSLAGQLPKVYMPSREVRQWRQLIRYRETLVGRRTAIKNRIRSVLDREGLSMAAGPSAWTQAGIEELTALAGPVDGVEAEHLWRSELALDLAALAHLEAPLRQVETTLDALGRRHKRVQLLQTIPGVGPRLAEALVALIDEPGRFQHGKQVASYLGLVPRQFQSGQMNRQGGITSHGDRLTRKLLVEVGWMTVRYNPQLREIYHRVCRGSPARRKIAVVAVARHLAITAWAMLRDEAPWSPLAVDEVGGTKPVQAATAPGIW